MKYKIIKELIFINIEENIDYYYEQGYFKYLKELVEKTKTKKEIYIKMNNKKIFSKLMKETIKDIKKIPYIYDFNYNAEKNLK